MKALLIYDTLSPARITEKMAMVIAERMKESGVEVKTLFIDEAGKANIKDYDCLILGAPTIIWWRPSKKMRDFLASLKGGNYSGMKAACYDTQVWSNKGNATYDMEKALKKTGFNIVFPSLIINVKSADRSYRLMEGETEKAQEWGQNVAFVLTQRYSSER